MLLQGSVGLVNAMQSACSTAASADSAISAKTEPILCLTRQGHSSLSFSGITGESSAGDYQDCGASQMLLMGEPPWCPPSHENSVQSSNRNDAVMRYKEKKKARKYVPCLFDLITTKFTALVIYFLDLFMLNRMTLCM